MEREIVQTNFVDSERVKSIHLALTKAYTKNDREAVKNAAYEAQKYIDDGGDIDYEIDDSLEDYNGDNPESLADMYLIRLLRDRHCDDDDDQEYIKTGLTYDMRIFHEIRCAGRKFTNKEWSEYCKQTYADPSKRIVTSIGKYDFNDFDICLNPTVMALVVEHGAYGYYVTLKWCDCGNGLWTYGLNYNCGNGGGCYGCSWSDNKGDTRSCIEAYHSEKECILACCDAAIRHIESGGKNDSQRIKLLNMVKDYKKSIGKPAPIQLELFNL